MQSVWSDTAKRQPNPPLAGDIKTDVLIIGGGMCGILTAHMLQESGAECVVVEAKTAGDGTTKNTTAKITAAHGLIYADLIERVGAEKARQYYDANTAAICRYRDLSKRFPCDFEEQISYVYSTDNRQKLEREAQACHRLKIDAKIEENLQLPMPVAGAVSMHGQAQFHPLKLLYALAEGLNLYENTFVHKIVGLTAHTSKGKITAKHIVLATHYPMINIRGLYFVKLYQNRSYVTAVEGVPLLNGMYRDEQEAGYSFRSYGDLLLVGGGAHRTGKKAAGHAGLQNFVRQAYPGCAEKYSWAAQDCMSLDQIPYVGRQRAGSANLYVAGGFNKWGMTGAMAAAKILTELIISGKSKWEALYTPQRSMLSRQLFVNLGAAAAGLLSIGGPRCSHMGCKLHRNRAENSWDCACHGSRFDQDGNVMDNPAKKEIRP